MGRAFFGPTSSGGKGPAARSLGSLFAPQYFLSCEGCFAGVAFTIHWVPISNIKVVRLSIGVVGHAKYYVEGPSTFGKSCWRDVALALVERG